MQRWGTIGLMIVVFIIRFIRTILVYIQNSGSSVFPAAAVMQVITIFPIFVIRMIFDIASLVKLFQHFSSVTNQPANKLVAFYQLGYSLVVEVILTFFSIVVAVLESQNYTGDDVADMDWIMISWAIGALLEQSQILTKLFHDDGKVSGTKTNTAKKTIENTGKASSTDL
ncbi:hypothetical protein HK103_007163 [Boothiomyces macroporosus]|uniref:Uncharacterized protein n=1 Tax=Boothiomyces macroporosus TaxID=261099 RepID=A0AAD5Y647_9FUNG|nr:hypothetical protein HK103_007163 [Boothiomyces macroporosus]